MDLDYSKIDFSKLETKDKWGLQIRANYGAEFIVFSLSIHYHGANDEEPCNERFAINLTVGSFSLVFGKFREYLGTYPPPMK